MQDRHLCWQKCRNGGALRGHRPSALWKGGQRGHRCPYI